MALADRPPRERPGLESQSPRRRLCMSGPRPAEAVGPAPWAADRRWRGLTLRLGRLLPGSASPNLAPA